MCNYHAAGFLSFILFLTLVGCSPAPAPDHYPTGTAVTLKMRIWSAESISDEQFQLGPQSSQLFLDMLTNLPVHSEISRMPASPYGTFSIGTVDYLWHGNGVIRGTGRDERLWHGPYLQRLIIEVMGKKELTNRQSVQYILDALEHDRTVATTRLQGPGQYPGGANDALHPSRLSVGDTNGWAVFEPITNKP